MPSRDRPASHPPDLTATPITPHGDAEPPETPADPLAMSKPTNPTMHTHHQR